MLEKLLPWVKNLKNPQSPNQSSFQYGSEVNLLHADNYLSYQDIIYTRFSNFSTAVILVVCVSLAFVLFLNLRLNADLNTLKTKQQILANEILSFAGDLESAKEVQRRGTFYQKVLNERKPQGKNVDSVISSVPLEITLSAFKLDDNTFSMNLSGENITLFSQLIGNLLQQENIFELKLISADYSGSSSSYTVSLEGKFK